MAEDKKPGIPELLAIAAIIYLLWRRFRGKKAITISFPDTENEKIQPDVNADLNGDPAFDLNSYCQNVVYKPLTNTGLVSNPLLGTGWCSRGDMSMIDPKKGFGDEYSDEQAADYEKRKKEEAAFIAGRDVVQFRLINTTSGRMTTNLLNITQDRAIFNPGAPAPVAIAATLRLAGGFTANWEAATGATGYKLDVATDNSFLSFVPGYQDLDVSNVLSYAVSGLAGSSQYYYRVRAYDGAVVSESSNIITATTRFNDYFLPSANEAYQMYVALKAYGIGDFINEYYWTSSENDLNYAWFINMTSGTLQDIGFKATPSYVRACRRFTTTDIYNLRDSGPAGGWIFYIIDNGGGSFTYYEAADSDQSTGQIWSNMNHSLIGSTGIAIGDGPSNTQAIISQAGHVSSAAKLCDDLIV